MACKVQTIGDNNPQVIIYMPFPKPDHAYTANGTCQGYMATDSRYD